MVPELMQKVALNNQRVFQVLPKLSRIDGHTMQPRAVPTT